MQIKPSGQQLPLLGVCGHAGAGHVHSHLGFIQDDSAGFAVASALIRMAYPADTNIQQVTVDAETVEVQTVGGGIGRAMARRGFTPYEVELMQRANGLDGLYSQGVAFNCFGRIYGQGVLEAPVAFQTAVCLAVINTFSQNYPDAVMVSQEGIPNNVGACMGALLDHDGITVAVMAVLNATGGGLGPAEDLEGNVSLAAKGQLMNRLGLDQVPTIVLESKAYVPSVCESLQQDSFWVRFNNEQDNPAVGAALIEAVSKSGLPMMHSDQAYPRDTGEMRKAVCSLSERIVDIGRSLEQASTSAQKVQVIADLALLVSQDAGGVTYMSDELHDIVAGGGLVPGTAAVLSLAVSQLTIEQSKIPEFTALDAKNYLNITCDALKILSSNLQQAQSYLERKQKFSKENFERLSSA